MISAGDSITITERLCSDKIQPSVRVGAKYFVKGTDKTKDGTEVVIVSDSSTKSGTQRINARRFRWTVSRDVQAAIDKGSYDHMKLRDVADKVLDLKGKQQISIIPMVCQSMVMRYSEAAADLSAKYRVEILRDLTKSVRQLRGLYDREVEKYIGYQCRALLDIEAKRFHDAFAYHFVTLYYSVNNEFKKRYPDYPFDDLRTNALIAVMFARFVDKQLERADEVLSKGIRPGLQTTRYRSVPLMAEMMEAMAGVTDKFDFGEYNIQTAFKVIDNDIHCFEWMFKE